jgi:hypothetical protein
MSKGVLLAMLNHFSRRFNVWLAAFALSACFTLIPSLAFAQRPIAPKLLPEQTLVYFRIASMPELKEKFQQTSTGKLAKDEQLKPLLGSLWQMGVDAFQNAEKELGVGLNELLSIPQGEICVAVVAPEEGAPRVVAWIDCGDKLITAEKLLDRGEKELTDRGAARNVEVLGDVELVSIEIPNARDRKVAYFIKEQTLVLSSDVNLAKQVLGQMRGEQAEDTVTLAENRKFTAIMGRSMGTKGEEPQVTWFVDPIELVRRLGRGDASTQTGLAIMSGLGVDGIKGLGGSLAFATEEYDGIFHSHILLETPRKGVIEALALQPGEVSPEPWVPADVESYMTLNWDVNKTYAEVVRLYELFRGGEGTWKNQVLAPVTDRIGIDLEKDLVQSVTGRLTMITWMDKPARINSQSTLLAIRLNDAAASSKVLDRLVERFPGRATKKSYGGVSYYEVPLQEQQPPNLSEEVFRPQVGCAAVMDDYLMLANNPKLLQQAIVTKSDPSRTLATELDFKIIASKIKRQLGDSQAGMILFSRPEEGMRQIYDLASSQAIRGGLKSQIENNKFFKGLDDALTANPLPPFAVLAQYLAPSGALVTSDETGFHYMAFSLKREQ